MFNISLKSNKQANAVVLFVDQDFDFNDDFGYFSKLEINQIKLFKLDFVNKNLFSLDLVGSKNKKKVIICKIKKNSSEFEF